MTSPIHYIESTIEHFTVEQPVYLNAYNRGEMTKAEFLAKVQGYIAALSLSQTLAKEVLDGFISYIWDFDALRQLVEDPDVTDIHCISHGNIRIKKIVDNKAVRQQSNVRFGSSKHYRRFIQHLAIRNKINLSEQYAIQHFVDKTSHTDFRLRCNIITDFLTCTEEPYLHIRKEGKKKKNVEELEHCGMFPGHIRGILTDAVQGSLIVAGASGSGKTAFINAFMELIPQECNGMIIQADDELFSDSHPELLPLHTIERRAQSGVEYSLQELARNGMLLDQDYLIFGEVKGAEARYAFTASNTGHRTWLSLHAPGTRAAIYKFADYIKFESDMKLEDIFRMLGDTVFTLIHITDYRIDELTKVTGFDEETRRLIFQDIPMEVAWTEQE